MFDYFLGRFSDLFSHLTADHYILLCLLWWGTDFSKSTVNELEVPCSAETIVQNLSWPHHLVWSRDRGTLHACSCKCFGWLGLLCVNTQGLSRREALMTETFSFIGWFWRGLPSEDIFKRRIREKILLACLADCSCNHHIPVHKRTGLWVCRLIYQIYATPNRPSVIINCTICISCSSCCSFNNYVPLFYLCSFKTNLFLLIGHKSWCVGSFYTLMMETTNKIIHSEWLLHNLWSLTVS